MARFTLPCPSPPRIRLGWTTLFVSSLLAIASSAPALAADSAAPRAKPADLNQIYVTKIVPYLKKNCLECHGPDAQEAEIAFHHYKSAEAVAADEKTWEKVVEMISTGAMPPEDSPQPTPAENKEVTKWIDYLIYHVDCDGGSDPGRVTIRRLNRTEYNNTVRDLLDVEFKPAEDFPSDDVGGGFDNNADVLSLPPLLMEKYLSAAEKIASSVIVADPSQLVAKQRKTDFQTEGAAKKEGGFYGIISAGAVSTEFVTEKPGQYAIRLIAGATQAGNELAKAEIKIDKKEPKILEVDAPRDDHKPYEFKLRLPAGKHSLTARFMNDFYDPDAKDRRRRDRNLYITAIEIAGPLEIKPSDYPEIHRKLIVYRPSDQLSVVDAARLNLKPLVNRAFRRKATDEEVNLFARLVEESTKAGDSFEQGMQVALTGVLVSPHFLFRVERDPKPGDPSSVHGLNDFELASRLSYFLWSTLPDDQLFAAANAGRLSDPAELERQVRRMLADPRSEALVQNFAAQWLNLRLLDGTVPSPQVFSSFSDELKRDMRRETELFFAAVMREDRSVLDFLDARFTFVNQRLAEHYGLKGVQGDEFRRVDLEGQKRAGVLTQASILTLTSNPGRTSPVKRGKWILENILGSPPPDPPADVPNLDTVQKAMPDASLRKQLEIHRENPVCASCHKVMDALGFGLENYDAIGRWRDRDGKHVVDASGALPGDEKFNGPIELAAVLKGRRNEFAHCLTEKMLTYALGRELEKFDRCAVEEIAEQLEAKDYKFSALVLGIVKSDPFRKRRGDGGQP